MMLRASSIPSGALPAYTYATLPVATSVPNGFMAFASDWGASGTIARSNGTRWLPITGQVELATLATSVSGLTNVEAISLQTLVPINALQPGDEIEVEVQADKSGSTDSATAHIRLGTAGTTSDADLIPTTSTPINTAGLSDGSIYRFRVVSATSIQRTGTIAGTGSFGSGNAATATPAAVTVTSAAANALYLSLSLVSTGATNTVGIRSARMRQLTA